MNNNPEQDGTDLARIRITADMKQAVVARNAGIDASRLSRIESNEIPPSEAEIGQVLQAIDTDLARAYLAFRQHAWTCLPRPSFWNPDRDSLVMADRWLAQLNGVNDPGMEPVTVAQIDLYRNVLKESVAYLIRLDHAVGFVGKVAVGKSAGICGLTGLVLGAQAGSAGPLSKRTVLEVASGRTTLCEVAIRTGPAGYFGVSVVPCSHEEVFRMASDYCASEVDPEATKSLVDSSSQTRGVPEEVGRALRNMAGVGRLLPTESETAISENSATSASMAAFGESLADVTAEFVRKMRLEQRTSTEFSVEEEDRDRGLLWVRSLFSKINRGQHAEVTLPRRIELTVPLALLGESPFEIRLIDTKGTEDTALRPDIRQHLDDPRTITVLCSHFNSAPDDIVRETLENLVETGGQRAISERVVIIVLARAPEVLDTRDDEGNVVETSEQGYRLKGDQIKTALRRISEAERVPFYFYDVLSDDPASVQRALIEHIKGARSRYTRQITEVCQAIETFLASRQKKEARKAHAEVRRRLRTFLDQHRQLPVPAQPHGNLFLNTLSTKHPRTVWATTRRNGTWGGLDAYHLLGLGTASEAQKRCQPAYDAFTALMTELLGEPSLDTARDYVVELQRAAATWRERFVAEANGNGREISRVALFDDHPTWNECERQWSLGRGFRAAVHDRLAGWFGIHPTLFELIAKRVSEAWTVSFVDPLTELAGASEAQPQLPEPEGRA